MFFSARAALYAVAALGASLTPTFADPSLALEAETTPVTAASVTHASASIDVAALTLNTVATTGDAVADFSSPLDEHLAVAPSTEAAIPLEEVDAAIAATPRVRSLADLVGEYASAEVADPEHECLAGAVYFESKGEPLAGQLAVAEVVINRANSGRFPKSLCGVVKQKSQFSFVRGGRIPPIRKSTPEWRKAVAIAHIAREDLIDSAASRALFFHARYVSPGWRNLKRVATVGNHIFYR